MKMWKHIWVHSKHQMISWSIFCVLISREYLDEEGICSLIIIHQHDVATEATNYKTSPIYFLRVKINRAWNITNGMGFDEAWAIRPKSRRARTEQCRICAFQPSEAECEICKYGKSSCWILLCCGFVASFRGFLHTNFKLKWLKNLVNMETRKRVDIFDRICCES